MKAIKFILTYYGISILLLLLSATILKSQSGEMASYLLWFYIYNIVIGVIMFPFLVWLLQQLNVKYFWKFIICLVMLLVMLNVVPYFADGSRIITIDLIKGFFGNQYSLLGFNNVGVHIIAVVSFILTFLIYRKKRILSPET